MRFNPNLLLGPFYSFCQHVQKIPIDAVDEDTNEPFLICIGNDCESESALQRVEYLLRKGWDVDVRTKYDETLLNIYFRNGYKTGIELLLDHKADFSVLQDMHWTNFFIEIYELIDSHGANMKKLFPELLHDARLDQFRDDSEIDFLLEKGFSIYTRNENGDLPYEAVPWSIYEDEEQIQRKLWPYGTIYHVIGVLRKSSPLSHDLIRNICRYLPHNNASGV